MITVVLVHVGKIDARVVKYVLNLLKCQHKIRRVCDIRLPRLGLFGDARADENGDCVGMNLLDGSTAGNHRRNGRRNMRDQLRINLLNHRNPHRTAAARELVILLGLNIFVKFQRFLQRQNIRKQRDFDHTRKTDLLERRTELAGCDRLRVLVDERGCDHGIDGRFCVTKRVKRRQNITALGEFLAVAVSDAVAAADTAFGVDDHTAVLDKQRVKIASRAALLLLHIVAVAQPRSNDDRVLFRSEQAGEMMRIIALLFDKVEFFCEISSNAAF